MNFRECRQNSIYRILKILDNDLTIQKTFMLLGGIRNGMYFLNYHGINLIGLSGCAEINCPGIFEILGVEFSCIQPDSFIQLFHQANNKKNNIYIIPILRDMLNTDKVDLDKLLIIGHSYLVVKSIDEKRIYFDTLDDNDDYYLDIGVFNKMNNKSQWVIESDFCVYEINIDKVSKNNKLEEFVNRSEKELLYDNVHNFLKNEKATGDCGTVRMDGEQVYEIVENHLLNMRKNLELVKNTDKYDNFTKYIYLQLVNIRKHIAAGSDGYYRVEFCDVLSNCTNTKIEDNIKKWNCIVSNWRTMGRKLAQVTNMKYLEHNADEALKNLIKSWNEIKHLEIGAMNELAGILTDP